MALVSVVVPAYNASGDIERCLGSLLTQSLRDIEVIVVDDGSTDDTNGKLQQVASADPRVRVIRTANAGPGAARNTGIDHAESNYIFFVDSDDQISELCIEAAYTVAERSGADITVVETNSREVMETLDQISFRDISSHDAIIDLVPAAWGKLIRKHLFENSSVRFPKLRGGEDLATTYQLFALAKRTVLVKGVSYSYRMGQLSKESTNMVLGRSAGLRYLLDRFIEMGLYRQYQQELEYLTYLHGLEYQIPIRMRCTPGLWQRARDAENLLAAYFPQFFRNGLIDAKCDSWASQFWLRLFGVSLKAIYLRVFAGAFFKTIRRRLKPSLGNQRFA